MLIVVEVSDTADKLLRLHIVGSVLCFCALFHYIILSVTYLLSVFILSANLATKRR